MDCRRGNHKTAGYRVEPPAVEGPVNGVNEMEKEEEEEEEEMRSLLPPAAKEGIAGKGKRSGKRKVQWNDCNGNQLVEVLEFYPSDSSDWEDEYLDSCICVVM